eukprot:4968299-Prymnesium_polylepis.2
MALPRLVFSLQMLGRSASVMLRMKIWDLGAEQWQDWQPLSFAVFLWTLRSVTYTFAAARCSGPR